ncbi:hypothetical protein QUG92_15865 [Curtobacterium sp. RHCKG23]|uniref:DUF8175 domain-containing protein n=1 Tax=Curtobacterium citri TaxID=3055139 RepID=A0ABT7TAJ0_9MICO|nr:hypothetical protein [Curtobacterium citri]MDM7886588.1 hypothetical protein [Curtobacterium citri]
MSNAEQPFYRRPLWIVVAIFLAVALVGGGIAIATSIFNGRADNTAAGPTPAPSSTGSSRPASSESICGLKGYETTNDLTAAPPATWKIIGSTATPQSASAGPGKTEDDGRFNTCFAHTPTGALFASVNYLAASTDSRNSTRLYELLADGDLKDQLKATPQPGSDGSAGTRAQVAGFKIDSYSLQETTVDVALSYTGETTDGQLVSLPMVMRWEQGDWKVVVDGNGSPVAPAALSSLGGYIPFSGV